MALFRSFNEIVNSMRDRLRLTQPNLDTKPGTVSRDLFIDIQAEQIEKLHRAVILVAEKQSPATATGADLDRWASNFGIPRKGGSQANGVAVFTTNELNADIPIPSNTVTTAKNGITYRTIGNFVMSVSNKNRYAATASRLRRLLNLAGVTDQYAIEVPVQATSSGTNGNIGPYQLINSNLQEGLKVTNLTSFSNGDNSENDAAFRSRVFASFSGANTGTSSGYRNAAISVTGVLDALVVEPGNTLMLRDGTETIEVNDGSFRILNSGTGGKVDIYILGSSLQEQVESYIYIDKSGNGDPTDDRNVFIPGISFLDNTLTSEERRLLAFNEGQIPFQPVDSIISISGNQSGLLTEKFTDVNGNVSGNYELVKDVNPDTGGSPFGYDYIQYISGEKDVTGEVIIKQDINSVDPLRFTDAQVIDSVYQDRQITAENSRVSSADRSIVYLSHSPIVTVSRVTNNTTGEVYIIESQNINSDTGLNEDGWIEISGKTLPTSADILSVDYTWRQIFDKYIDYNGDASPQAFIDESVSDSIDWGVPNGVFIEESIITESDDGFEYQVETDYNVSRVISVYTRTETTAVVANLTDLDGETVSGLTLAVSDDAVDNIISIQNSSGLEVWNTQLADGSFNNRVIYLPSDSPVQDSETLTVYYNRVEFFSVENTDGSFSNNIITLPSEDILRGADVFDAVQDTFLVEDSVYVSYVAEIDTVLPLISLTSLPISGSDDTDRLSDVDLALLETSNQPIFFELDGVNRSRITRFGPTKLACSVTGTVRAGKIKITGTTLTRVNLTVLAGTNLDGLTIDIKDEVLELFNLDEAPSALGIARVDSVTVPEDSNVYDIAGYSLDNNTYDLSYASADTSLDALSFTLPSTSNNLEINPSSATEIVISCLIYYDNDFEDLYFPGDKTVISDKVFGRINNLTVSSGFRSSVGSIVGSIKVEPANQPDTGISYSSDYSFQAPKEGERITVRYSTNSLIADVTRSIEDVRSITADVLVKEAFDIEVDVAGEVLINEDASESETQIIENVVSAVVNLLNTGTLGSIIDYSDIINVATSVTGVDSLNVSLFNESGKTGRKTFIKALDNQTISAGNVTFESVSRQDFRIT